MGGRGGGEKAKHEIVSLLLENKLSPKGLVTNSGEGAGGSQTVGGGGACEVLPLRKGEAEQVLDMLKGRHTTLWGSFYMVALSFSHFEGGGEGGAKSTL